MVDGAIQNSGYSQARKAGVSAISIKKNTTKKSSEEIDKFFSDDPDAPYHPLPQHSLEQSRCRSIIRTDNHSFYCCTLHPEVQSIHLESIEHHCKYKDGETHHSEILKSLDNTPTEKCDFKG